MRAWPMVLLAGLLLSQPAPGRDGFAVSLGLGGGIWHLPNDSLGSSLAQAGRPALESRLLTDTLDDGLAIRFSMGYTILGWATVELGMTGHGWNLDDADAIGGSGHVSLVGHFHPAQIWWPDRDWDATVFLGGGYTIMGGGQPNDDYSRGLDGGMLECGLTGRYYLLPWLSLGAEARFTVPVFQRWFVDWDNDVTASLDSAPDALFVALLFVTTFHFQPGGAPAR